MSFPLDDEAAQAALRSFAAGHEDHMAVWDTVGGPITDELEERARDIAQQTGLAWWDAVLVVVGTLKDRAEHGALLPLTYGLLGDTRRL